MKPETSSNIKTKQKNNTHSNATIELMLESKTLRGLVVENENVEKSSREEFMDNMASMVKTSNFSVNAIQEVWKLYQNEARKKEPSLPSNSMMQKFIDAFNEFTDNNTKDFLELKAKDVKLMDKVKDFFLAFGDKEKETLRNSRIAVEVSEELQDVLIKTHEALLAVVVGQPSRTLNTSEPLKKIFLKEFSNFEKKSKKNKWIPSRSGVSQFIGLKDEIANEIAKVLSLLSVKVLQAGLQRLKQTDANFSDRFLKSLQTQEERPARPSPRTPASGTPEIPGASGASTSRTPPPPPGTPASGTPEIPGASGTSTSRTPPPPPGTPAESRMPTKISKDEIYLAIVGERPIDPAQSEKVNQIIGKINNVIKAQTSNQVFIENFKNGKSEKNKTIMERFNRLAGLPPLED